MLRRQHACKSCASSLHGLEPADSGRYCACFLRACLHEWLHGHYCNTTVLVFRCIVRLLPQEAGFRFQYPEVTAALRSVAR
jgi:Domain of unknown function (DUF1731)